MHMNCPISDLPINFLCIVNGKPLFRHATCMQWSEGLTTGHLTVINYITLCIVYMIIIFLVCVFNPLSTVNDFTLFTCMQSSDQWLVV